MLERLAEKACEDTWRNISDDLRQIIVEATVALSKVPPEPETLGKPGYGSGVRSAEQLAAYRNQIFEDLPPPPYAEDLKLWWRAYANDIKSQKPIAELAKIRSNIERQCPSDQERT